VPPPTGWVDLMFTGINNGGQIDGITGGIDGFFKSGDSYTLIEYSPNPSNTTWVRGINDAGQVVGWSFAADYSNNHAFVWSSGSFSELDILGYMGEWALDINNHGDILVSVNNYGPDPVKWFLLHDGAAIPLDLSGISGTVYLQGMNDQGDVVGVVQDGNHASGILLHILDLQPPANHNPVFDQANSTRTGTVAERASLTGSVTLDQVAGVLSFSDADLGDRPTATIGSQTAAYKDASGVTVTLDRDQLATLKAGFTIVPEVGNTNSGKIDWGFSIADKALDFLGAGETVVLRSTVQLDDHHGGTSTQDVSVTITGVDDVPAAFRDYAVARRGELNEADATQGVLANDADADWHDLLRVEQVNGQAAYVGKAITGAYGKLRLNSDGSYSYSVNKGVLQNANLLDVFSYTVGDGHGSSSLSSISITIQKGDADQALLPFNGSYEVTQGPDDKGFGDHTKFMKWSYDFNLPVDTSVLSVGHGTVVDLREYVPDGSASSMIKNRKGELIPDPNDPSNGTGNFGNYVTVKLDDGSYVTYLHFGHDKISVALGQQVNAGETLGFVGLTGARTGAHLHVQFGIAQYHSPSIAASIQSVGSDATNHVQNILADGASDPTSPRFFESVTVHLHGPDNLYKAGPGSETFLFRDSSDGGYTISGFQHGVDVINLHALDANTNTVGNQDFAYAGERGNVLADSLSWSEQKGNTIVQGDVTGDAKADFDLILEGTNLRLSIADFIL
jgi:probable HAF family extracellular repeat protein/VCBS repeat-containing protein